MKYFKIELFAISSVAKSKRIDNSVPAAYRSHAEELINMILDPLHDAWGGDIYMTSGYRSIVLNNIIGGSKTSAHSYAYAVDLIPANGKVEEFKDFTMHWLFNNNIKFDLYINEYKGNKSWVHIGIRNNSGQLRQQYKLFYNGKYTSIDPLTFRGLKNRNISNQINNSTDTLISSIILQDINTTLSTTIYDNGFATGGGNTQTGNTKGLLMANAIYYNNIVENINGNSQQDNIDIEQIKNNNIFIKDENGDPILDENGNPAISDEYLYGIDEGDDMIDNEDIPNINEVYPELPNNQIEDINTTDNSSTILNNVPTIVDIEDKNAKTPEEKALIEKIKLKRNLKNWLKKSEDLSKEEAKEKLYKWLKTQPIILLNAFYIIVIKDMIDRIKSLSLQLQNTSQYNMMNLLNSLYNIIGIFEDLGLTPDAEGITMDDLKDLGMAVVGTLAETSVDMGNQVYLNYLNNVNLNMVYNALDNVARLTAISYSLPDNAKAIGVGVATNVVDNGINNVINTTQNMDMNSVTGASDELKNSFKNITNNKSEPFTYSQSNNGKTIKIDIIINKDPALNGNKIKSFLTSFKLGNNENIFDAAAIKYIKNTFNNVWKTKEEQETYVDAVIDGITKHYIFNFTINNNQNN